MTKQFLRRGQSSSLGKNYTVLKKVTSVLSATCKQSLACFAVCMKLEPFWDPLFRIEFPNKSWPYPSKIVFSANSNKKNNFQSNDWLHLVAVVLLITPMSRGPHVSKSQSFRKQIVVNKKFLVRVTTIVFVCRQCLGLTCIKIQTDDYIHLRSSKRKQSWTWKPRHMYHEWISINPACIQGKIS
jgi:hypothetical protein